jgi:NAD(P)-dependent dehydrogenase (short-subunit alcohol dehydrogenase family)
VWRSLSETYGGEGVLVNAVSPAFIATPMTDAMRRSARRNSARASSRPSAVSDEERPFVELKRRGEPEEVAAVIAFLVSERASFVDGSTYRVDSGSVATV